MLLRIIIFVVLTEQNPVLAIRILFCRCAFILVPFSVLFIKYYPDLGRAYTRAGGAMATGVTTQKNSLGEVVLVCSLFLLWDLLETRDAQKNVVLKIQL